MGAGGQAAPGRRAQGRADQKGETAAIALMHDPWKHPRRSVRCTGCRDRPDAQPSEPRCPLRAGKGAALPRSPRFDGGAGARTGHGRRWPERGREAQRRVACGRWEGRGRRIFGSGRGSQRLTVAGPAAFNLPSRPMGPARRPPRVPPALPSRVRALGGACRSPARRGGGGEGGGASAAAAAAAYRALHPPGPRAAQRTHSDQADRAAPPPARRATRKSGFARPREAA